MLDADAPISMNKSTSTLEKLKIKRKRSFLKFDIFRDNFKQDCGTVRQASRDSARTSVFVTHV